MLLLQEFGPVLLAMILLGIASAFFSCSEAAMFSLQSDDRRYLKKGSAAQRIALVLLEQPDRLLMAILFWNLSLNIVYFALASLVSIRLETQDRHTEAGLVAVGSLVAIILGSEMAPKTLGVLAPRSMAGLVSLPLAVAVRLFGPLAPTFSAVNSVVRRLFFPNFQAEPYLELSDIEKAITISTPDAELASQERSALQNIVQLSELSAEEVMRPRTQYKTFTPPVSIDDLGGEGTPSGYLLITEEDTEEIAGAIPLNLLPTIPRQHLEQFAQPAIYMPWCASVAAVFDELRTQAREVAAIVNEFGETVGIITLEDLLHNVFEDQPSRSIRILQTASIRKVGENRWHVTGMTSLRRLSRTFHVTLPKSKNTTVAGILQEILQRMPEPGDEVNWSPFYFQVLEFDLFGKMKVELRFQEPGEEQQ